MRRKKVKPNYRKTILRLPDLDHSKSSVLNSLSSPGSRRAYGFAIDQFIAWYCSEPRLALNRAVVLRFRLHLESLGLAAATINQRLAAAWALNAEASRRQLGQLSADLQVFWAAEQAFEQRLPTESMQRVQPQFSAIHQLFQHLQADTRNLDEELSKGMPTRWHVNRDVLDMQKEIQRWRKLQQAIAATLG